MKRRLLNLLTLLSLLLCVAVVVLWVRSYFTGDMVERGYVPDPLRHGMYFKADFNRGMVRIERYDFRSSRASVPLAEIAPLLQPGISGWITHGPRPQSGAARYLLAFQYKDHTDHPAPWLSERTREIVVPLWTVAALFGIAPALFVRRYLRRCRRTREGKCPSCGYDLRATPGRCPECGKAATTPE